MAGEPGAFRATRSFAVMSQSFVQVFRLNFKSRNLSRPPSTAAECCLYLAQLSQPQGSGPMTSQRLDTIAGSAWSWSFDDAKLPGFDEQLLHLEQSGRHGGGLPPLVTGRWLQGLLRFLATVLRPVWEMQLVAPTRGSDKNQLDGGLCLAIGEDSVRQLLSRLKPAICFAKRALAQACEESSDATPATPTTASAVPTSSAARFRLYTQQRSASNEGIAQARQMLKSVLDVADRAQQVLGLLSVLHRHRNAYRILQSQVLGGQAVRELTTLCFESLVSSDEALEPVVQLCTALVVESGLTTPAAESVFSPDQMAAANAASGRSSRLAPGNMRSFASAEICRDLEELCSPIFERVDISFVRSRLRGASSQTSTAAGLAFIPPSQQFASAMELLHCYSQCILPGAPEDHWLSLSESLRKAAVEKPRQAVEVCVEKLQQLQLHQEQMQDKVVADLGPGAEARAKQLLEALLGAMASEPLGTVQEGRVPAQSLVEQLLTKTSSLHFASDRKMKAAGAEEAAGSSCVSFVHGVVLDHLLASPQLRSVLEVLLDGRGVGTVGSVKGSLIEAFLSSRCHQSHAAGALLWKHRLRQRRPY
eukprot:TRINITY_DN37344_c0_g1_i1.p1 TRINITY_DN37344_c0_g1~~TRINITY_DN37344_c0_g1_i1.p1  ORF type:complete len:647 (+),score=135.44 TRINITY_DN37344_c0_g1_i1:170-1942(+)